jgi:hypothetical protein
MCASPLDFLRSGRPRPGSRSCRTRCSSPGRSPCGGRNREPVVSAGGAGAGGALAVPAGPALLRVLLARGAGRALAFAAYRRRFTVDQVAEWNGARARDAGLRRDPGLRRAPRDDRHPLGAGRPDRGPLGPGPGSDARAPPCSRRRPRRGARQARAELIRAAGEARRCRPPSPPVAQPSGATARSSFAAGELRSVLPAAGRGRPRRPRQGGPGRPGPGPQADILLWRVALGSLAACLAARPGRGSRSSAPASGRRPASPRSRPEGDRRPHHGRAGPRPARIDDLSTKRLLPLEMISTGARGRASQEAPTSIQFLRATATTASTRSRSRRRRPTPGEIAATRRRSSRRPRPARRSRSATSARDNVVLVHARRDLQARGARARHVMIRTLRAFFLARFFREKLLLTGFTLAVAAALAVEPRREGRAPRRARST